MGTFKFELGATVNVVGHFNGGAVVGRCTWETLAHPEPTNWYSVRLGDKEVQVSEAEVTAVEAARQTDTA